MSHLTPKRFAALLLTTLLVLSIVAGATFQVGPSHQTASAHGLTVEATISHISWSPARVDNNPTFSATLKGHGFPADDVEPILVSLDATLGGVCASATWSPPVTNSDGSWSTLVHFTNCFANNNILASAVDDHHLNHAVLHIN